MTVQVAAATYPTIGAPPKRSAELLSLADVQQPGPGSGWLDGQGLFESYNCLDTGVVLGNTCGPVAQSKFTGAVNPTWVDGLKFAAYGAVVCKMIDGSNLEGGISAAFDAAESRLVERALMENFLTANAAGSGLPGAWAAAPDITPTPGTAVDPTVGLGLLESHMGENYAGKGIIHTPRVVATVLNAGGALDWEGDTLVTGLKTPVAAGAGYDLPNSGPAGPGTPATGGNRWMFATGQVLLVPIHKETRSEFQQYAGTTGLQPNDVAGITEAVYMLAVDCYKAAVLVKAY